jgi:hypothetical protein
MSLQDTTVSLIGWICSSLGVHRNGTRDYFYGNYRFSPVESKQTATPHYIYEINQSIDSRHLLSLCRAEVKRLSDGARIT